MKNIKITFSEPRYFVNGTTTICVLNGEFYGKAIETVGIAKLSPSDVFDEYKGKKIAQAKAENKAYKRALQINKVNTERLFRHIQACALFEIKADKVMYHNEKYIKGL